MYKIPKFKVDEDAHFRTLNIRVKELMQEFLKGKPIETSFKDGTKVLVQLEPDSCKHSLARDWLQRCVDNDRELRRLLCGDFAEQRRLIKEVYSDSPDHFRRIFNRNAPSSIKNASQPYFMDCFHEIMRHIFVDRLFEGKYNETHPMDKDSFVESLDLLLCPYCGDTYIRKSVRTAHGRVHEVSPSLDHFLPKSIYPFLALNCYNLIPACAACNLSPNKGIADPLGADKRHEYLMNPYQFRDDAFDFGYSLNGVKYYEENNYDVLFFYHGNNDLMKGYQELMTTESHYKNNHRHTVGEIFRSFVNQAKTARQFYKGVHIPEQYWVENAESVLRFPLRTPYDIEQPAYKLQKDLYEKMKEQDWDEL
jgi:hypothetical protein